MGSLLITGISSDAGKSVLVAGICRWLAKQGAKVAPFKASEHVAELLRHPVGR